MAQPNIGTQFVQVGERRVFVRHAGRGPAVLLVHQSPENSSSLLPWFESLASRFAVFAPDTPGFGLSDPLPLAQPTIPDLAAALGRLIEALNIGPVLLYGVHTGAAIAARLARDEPARVAALVCDGLSAFTAAERRPLLDGYLPPFEPVWDGTHLVWLWARMREQKLFFPWQAGTAAARIPYPLPSAQTIHKEAMELLDAGDGYRAGYRAPLLYEHGAAGAAQIGVPTALLYRKADVLRPHLERLPPLPPQVQAREVADADTLMRETLRHFQRHAGAAATVAAEAAVQGAAAPGRRIVQAGALRLAFWCAEGDAEQTELTLPDIGTPATLAVDRAPGARALTLEWPGHGASGGCKPQHIEGGALLADLVQALDTLGVQTLRLRARGGAAALAALLAQRLGPRCTALELADPLPLNAAESAQFLSTLPSLLPDANGSHFIAAWNWARLRHLFWPWLMADAPDAQAAIEAAAPPPRRVHGDVVEMLRAPHEWPALWRAALAVDMPAELRQLRAQGLPIALSAAPHAEMQRLLARLQTE
jgi:pimeloyl-ACP methyl ester carboxylesterase